LNKQETGPTVTDLLNSTLCSISLPWLARINQRRCQGRSARLANKAWCSFQQVPGSDTPNIRSGVDAKGERSYNHADGGIEEAEYIRVRGGGADKVRSSRLIGGSIVRRVSTATDSCVDHTWNYWEERAVRTAGLSRWPTNLEPRDGPSLTFLLRSREIVLGRVAALVKKFVTKVSLARGLSEAAANAAGGKIFTFGSYRLGVHGPGSDIDTLCVVPKHVSREDFFETFEPMLKSMEGVTEVSVRDFAKVPPLRTVLTSSLGRSRGIRTDHQNKNRRHPSRLPYGASQPALNTWRSVTTRWQPFARAWWAMCPELGWWVGPYAVVFSFLKRLLGSRQIGEILRLVPNVAVFRDALRCIKLWAQRM